MKSPTGRLVFGIYLNASSERTVAAQGAYSEFRELSEDIMRSILNSVASSAICASAVIMVQPSTAQAGVMNIVPKAAISQPAPIDQVHYWGYYHWRHRHHWHHAHYWRPWRYRHYHYAYYPRYYYPGYYPWFNPAGAIAGAAVGLATAPFWALTGGPFWR